MKEVNKPREFKAKFESYTNDMYWTICFFDDNLWFKFVWTGYNDDYWWTKVAPTKTRKTVIGKNIDGKLSDKKITLEIDFTKCIAKEILNEEINNYG